MRETVKLAIGVRTLLSERARWTQRADARDAEQHKVSALVARCDVLVPVRCARQGGA